jgi:hypothetical protein
MKYNKKRVDLNKKVELKTDNDQEVIDMIKAREALKQAEQKAKEEAEAKRIADEALKEAEEKRIAEEVEGKAEQNANTYNQTTNLAQLAEDLSICENETRKIFFNHLFNFNLIESFNTLRNPDDCYDEYYKKIKDHIEIEQTTEPDWFFPKWLIPLNTNIFGEEQATDFSNELEISQSDGFLQ